MYFSTCFVFVFSGNSSDVLLLRGAVFFIGMCLWGSQRVTTLKHSHSTVLPSMLQVSVYFVVVVVVVVVVTLCLRLVCALLLFLLLSLQALLLVFSFLLWLLL